MVAMARSKVCSRLYGFIGMFALLLASVQPVSALKYSMLPLDDGSAKVRCIRNLVPQHTLVVVTPIISDPDPSSSRIELSIYDNMGNIYATIKDCQSQKKTAFTVEHEGYVDVCTRAVLGPGVTSAQPRIIELDIDIGAYAQDPSDDGNTALKPIEYELRRIDALVGELISSMEYLKVRELRMRDTNESTNERVKLFAIIVIAVFIGLGIWQIKYMQRFFQRKGMI